MSRTKRPAFSIYDDFVISPSRSMTFNGTVFNGGDDFPWKEIGCTPRRLNLLFDARRIISKREYEKAFGQTGASGEPVKKIRRRRSRKPKNEIDTEAI